MSGLGRGVLTAALLAATSLSMTVFGASGAEAVEAADSHVSLGLTGFGDVAVDPAHDWVYVSGSPSDDHLVAVHPDGTSMRQIPVAGAGSLAVSSDGTQLAASLPAQHAIAVVDTATDAVTTYPLADQACPGDLAIVVTKVWFTNTCHTYNGSPWYDSLNVLDTVTGQNGTGVYPYNISEGAPHAVPGTHDLLVLCCGGYMKVIDSDTENALGDRFADSSYEPVTFGPDPGTVWTGLTEFSLPDLTPIGSDSDPDSNAVTVAVSDDYVVKDDIVDSQLNVYDRQTSALVNQIVFGGADLFNVQGVTFAGPTLVGFVAGRSSLTMYFDPTPGEPAPELTVLVAPDEVVFGHEATISGTLSDHGVPVSGAEIDVSSPGGVQETVATDANGGWAVHHTWDAPGSDYLTVVAPGDATRKSAVTRRSIVIDKITAHFGLDGPTTVRPGDTVDISGTFTVDGAPTGGTSLHWFTECDSGSQYQMPSGTVTTASDGSFSVGYDPQKCLAARLVVEYAGDADVYDSWETFDTSISWQVRHVHATIQAGPYVGGNGTASVTVTDRDGQPVADAPVTVHLYTPTHTGFGSPLLDVSGSTDSQGVLTVSFDASDAGSYAVYAEIPDTADTLGDYDDAGATVDYHHSGVGITTAAGPYVGDGGVTTVSVWRDGLDAAGVPVVVTLSPPSGTPGQAGPDVDLSGVTDSTGQLTAAFDTPFAGPYTITAKVLDTADTVGSIQTDTQQVAKVPSALTIVAEPQQGGVVGDPVTISGRLTHPRGTNAGQTIVLTADDQIDGTALRSQKATTDADGDYTFRDVPSQAGITQYTVSYAGDGTYAATDVTTLHALDALQPRISLSTDRRSYAAGATADIEVDLTHSPSRHVTVTSQQPGAPAVLLFDGTVPQGGLTLHRLMRHNQTITVDSPADASQSAATASVALKTILGLRLSVSRPAAVHADTYMLGKRSRFSARIFPARAGVCVRFATQRRTPSGWTSSDVSQCVKTDAAGGVIWRFSPSRPPPTTYRVRAVFGGDALNAAAHTRWIQVQKR